MATTLVHADHRPIGWRSRWMLPLPARRVRGYVHEPADDRPAAPMFASYGHVVRCATVSHYAVRARLRAVAGATRRGAVLLAVAVAFMLIGAWARPSPSAQRLLAATTAIGALALAPLNPTFSSVTRLFDPVVYLAPLGGPLTASVGALMLTSGLVLLGLLAALRAPVRRPSRWLARLAVVAIAALGPFLLRDLARGISPPPWGVTSALWLSWEVALFLAGVAILLAGVSAGQALLARRRGLSPMVAPTFAAVAAVIAPLLVRAGPMARLVSRTLDSCNRVACAGTSRTGVRPDGGRRCWMRRGDPRLGDRREEARGARRARCRRPQHARSCGRGIARTNGS